MYKIIVICTGNSCRSQMAEAWLKYFLNKKLEVHSAGTSPDKLNVNAVKVMHEVGIDISKQTSNHIEEYVNIDFDYVITVCDNARANCPHLQAKIKNIHQNFYDPALAKGNEDEILNVYRRVRDEIKTFCKDFLDKL